MSRLISLIVLIACIVIIGILFYKVMVGFFVPLFLAAVLVVVFRPLHRKVHLLVNKRDHIAAGVTTLLITSIVLLPAALVATFATIQGISLFKSISVPSVRVAMTKGQEHFKLQQPGIDEIRVIDAAIEGVQILASSRTQAELADIKGEMAGYERTINENLRQLTNLYLGSVKQKANEEREKFNATNLDPAAREIQTERVDSALQAKEAEINRVLTYDRKIEQVDPPLDPEAPLSENAQFKNAAAPYELPNELDGAERIASPIALASMHEMLETLDRVTPSADKDDGDPGNEGDLIELQSRAVQLGQRWQELRTALMGGTAMGFLREIANPSDEQISDFTNNFIRSARPKLLELTGATGAFLFRLGIGTAVMIVSLFFFLYDGPAMIRALMRLSPLDDRYELELLTEFDRVVRAIVLALIASAIVQGLTAGIGYYFAGMPTLVFLVLITTLCALIPFVGPAITWVPVCIYLAVYEERFMAAGMLALWGVLVVGSVDNVVKTLVLHGQSSLHPLFALLSILGGVQALGPIGIVVGPIVVTLLQTLLSILQRELNTMDQEDSVRLEPVLAPEGTAAAAVEPEKGGFANMLERLKERAAAFQANQAKQSNSDGTSGMSTVDQAGSAGAKPSHLPQDPADHSS